VKGPLPRLPRLPRLHAFFRRLGRDTGGNMMLIVAGILVTTVAMGLGVDYGRAVGLQSRLAAAGHAAAMAAVSPALMAQDAATAQAQVSSQFVGQVRGLAGLVFDPQKDLVVTVGASASGGRVAVVRWNARYATLFGGLFGAGSLPVAGSAQGSADGAPNIDFAVLVLASSSGQQGSGKGGGGNNGLDNGRGNGGVNNGGKDNGGGNSASSGDLQQAAQALIPLAQDMAAKNGVAYKLDIAAPDSANSASYGAALDAMAAGMAAAGDGATPTGAQAVILLATDGAPGAPSADDLASCAAIKSRGFAIAVFYAPASSGAGQDGQWGRSDPSNWYGNGGSGQDAVAAGLQACASLQQGGAQTGGAALFLQQGSDRSTPDALAALFAMAAGNAHLVH